jgi:uncharacterized protein
MRIIVTGGTGQIGLRFCHLLASAGHDVWVTTRWSGRASTQAGIQFVTWDGETSQGWSKLVDGADAVVNLAGENIGGKRWSTSQMDLIRRSRALAGKAVMEAIKQAVHLPRVFIQASAVGYYGTRRQTPLDESSPSGEDELTDICQDWEASTRPVEDLGVRRIIIRTGVVLDKTKGALPRLVLPFEFFVGGPLGNGSQVYSWIHLTDQINAMRFLLENPRAEGVYNLTAPEPATNREFGKILGEVLHRPFWMPVPAFALKMLLGDQSKLVLEGQRVLPRRLVEAGYQFQFPHLKGALEDLFL